MASEPRILRTNEEDGVTVLLLRNPPVNALSTGVLQELGQEVGRLAEDPNARAVVLGGDGANFSAGADLKELASLDPARAPEMLERSLATFATLSALPVPTIAAVHGLAVGGGLELALACDLRVADDSAKFGAPEVAYGLMPAYGGTQRLPRLIGVAKAKELVFTGTLLPASEALRIGLVNKIVGGGQELRAARDLAHTIGQRAPRAVRAAKRAIAEGLDLDLAAGLALESRLVASEVLPSQDLVEGIRGFVERRPPKFRGN
jgi:enoyl-CoA hydratase